MKKIHCKSKHCQRHNVKYPSSIHLLKDDNYIKIMIKKSDDYDYGDGDAQAHMIMLIAHGDVTHPISTSSIVPPSNSATLRMGSI